MDGRIVFITQRVDAGDPVLAATLPKIAALAARTSEVSVLAGDGSAEGLPENARLHSFAAPGRLGRGLRFEAVLGRELARRPRPAAVLAHMCPIYAVLAAPLARPLGVPVLLWYSHWHASATLRAAERLASVVISVDRRSFPLPSRKVVPIGHGIDPEEFPCRPRSEGSGPLRALALGRYSPAKGLEAVLRAIGLASGRGVDVSLDVHGPALNGMERRHRDELARGVDELGLDGRVRLADSVRRSEVPVLFAEHDVLIDNMRPGAPDKVVYEAAASCLPVLASNPVFDTLLDERLRFPTDDAAALAGRLEELAALPAAARRELGAGLREGVLEGHSVAGWAERVLAAAERS